MTKISTIPKAKIKLTEKDRQLLELLQHNARESNASLARKIGVSRATIQERIQRLENAEIIQGYSVNIDHQKLPRSIDAIVMVLAENKSYKETYSELEKMHWVRRVHTLSGEWDWSLYVSAPTLEEFHANLTAINQLPGIKSTVSHIIMETKLDRCPQIKI